MGVQPLSVLPTWSEEEQRSGLRDALGMALFGAVQGDWGPCQDGSMMTLARLRDSEYSVFKHHAESLLGERTRGKGFPH